jgi:hypothetical protein
MLEGGVQVADKRESAVPSGCVVEVLDTVSALGAEAMWAAGKVVLGAKSTVVSSPLDQS